MTVLHVAFSLDGGPPLSALLCSSRALRGPDPGWARLRGKGLIQDPVFTRLESIDPMVYVLSLSTTTLQKRAAVPRRARI